MANSEYWRHCNSCGHESYYKQAITGTVDCPKCGNNTFEAHSLKKPRKLSYKGIMRGSHGTKKPKLLF